MDTGYVAYGLALRSAFPLPGMISGAGGALPSVRLETVGATELEDAGGGGLPAWRGRLGDGEELAIAWGRSGDLLFAYGDRARFRFDRATGVLQCAPRDLSELAWQRILLSRVLPNVSLAHGREALHASAVQSPSGVVAIAAPSETGKSTLATELMRRGWPIFGDDVLVLARGEGGVEAHPGTPHVNLAEGAAGAARLGSSGTTLGVFAGKRWMTVRDCQPIPGGVAAVFLFERGPGLTLEATPLPASPLGLAPYMLGLPDEVERESARFQLYSDLVESTALIRLTADPRDDPGMLADTIESALAGVAHPVFGGVA